MNRLFLDPHVHLHPQVPLKAFLDTAIGNFQTHGKARTTDRCGLVLTDVHGTDSFSSRLMTEEAPDWQLIPSSSAMTAKRPDGWELTLWPGRQLVSSEGLEVLALGPMADLPEKTLSTAELISAVLQAGALPLLPWGVGKWTATRGQRVDQLLQDIPSLAVADNGNRLRGTALPRRLRTAREQGHPLWQGSDPLPVPGAALTAGSHGVSCPCPEDLTATDLSAMLHLLRGPGSESFGRLTPLPAFFFRQAAMQLRKRLP